MYTSKWTILRSVKYISVGSVLEDILTFYSKEETQIKDSNSIRKLNEIDVQNKVKTKV